MFCRLEDDGASCRECREGGTRRDGDGEVPRRGNNGERAGHECRTVNLVELFGEARVIAGKVACFRNFGVCLVDGFAGFRHGYLNEVAAVFFEQVSGAAKNFGAFRGGNFPPLGPAADCFGNGCIEISGCSDCRRFDEVGANVTLLCRCDDAKTPFAYRFDSGIGVGGVLERGPLDGTTVRRTVG